ncbi:hypothetical protein ACR76M_12435 [Enterococcus innesii]|uniref:hypothetical protein n=1 Tax=Enterococcus TaxID=1350 RepID=UPI000B64E62C|nr:MULTISPECIES: hypothetical protein [unclassified Enterococcus]MEC5316373.1 hypothetical protein [Enterococcus casseliflavus]OTO31579.1 hypothetical protein A5876_002195 [Enterococcus sp. 3C8_DIV0646]
MLDEFKERYIEECIINGRMSEDLSSLFEVIAHEEFGDDPLKMDAFIQSIVDENTEIKPSELDLLKQENEELKQRQEMTEEALLTLSDMLLSR